MKKTLLIIFALITVIVALPIVGNSMMESTINTRVSELDSYGLKSKNIQEESDYFTTKKHFEFVLENADEFVNYLSQFSDQQIPPYVNAMFEGVVIGADLEYSNFPLSKAIQLDIYPLELSQSMSEDFKKNDLDFYAYLEKFLHSKGVLYHINYNIVSEDFDGYVKDIDESHTLKNETTILLKLHETIFEGNGQLIAPNRLETSLKELQLDIKKGKLLFTCKLKNMKTTTNYESKNTYLNAMQLEEFTVDTNGTEDDFSITGNTISVNASSNTQGEFAELDSKVNIKSIAVDSSELQVALKDWNLDLALNGLDKESFNKTQELISKARATSTPKEEQELEESLTTLVSKGFVFSIADFSIQNITVDATENLKGLSLKSELKLKADPDIAQKIKMSPMLLVSNIELATYVKVSKELYARLTNDISVGAYAKYIREENDNLIFDIKLIDGELTLNGRTLQ